jgi:hypothetical protein
MIKNFRVDFFYEHKEDARAPRTNTGRLNPGPRQCYFCLLANKARIKQGECTALLAKGYMSNPLHRLRPFRFARDDKEPGSSWGRQLSGERPRETAET